MLTRRDLLRSTSLLAAGAGLTFPGCSQLRSVRSAAPLRIGLVTDVHYADKDTAGTREYRRSLDKLSVAVKDFNEARADFIVELGDFIDSGPTVDEEFGYLQRIEAVYAQAHCPRYHVLGNHCVYSLTKEQFLTVCQPQRSSYSFEGGGFHFVILDACFRHDGQPYGKKNFEWTDANIPPAELEWLEADLKSTRHPTVVFIHQRLDVENHYGAKPQAEVRERLEASGKVVAVFQGHNHINDFKVINKIPYCTMTAMVEGSDNAYGLLTLRPNGVIHVDGYGRQESRSLTA